MMYFISYDIADPKRLSKIAKILENFGIRIQFSFFECEMEKNIMERLRDSVLELMDNKKDSLRIYPLCEDCLKKTKTMGKGNIFIPQNFIIM